MISNHHFLYSLFDLLVVVFKVMSCLIGLSLQNYNTRETTRVFVKEDFCVFIIFIKIVEISERKWSLDFCFTITEILNLIVAQHCENPKKRVKRRFPFLRLLSHHIGALAPSLTLGCWGTLFNFDTSYPSSFTLSTNIAYLLSSIVWVLAMTHT